MSAQSQKLQTAGSRGRRSRGNVGQIVRILILAAVLGFLLTFVTPARVRYHMSQGQSAIREGQLKDAVQQFENVLALDASSGEAHFWLARCFRKLGDLSLVQTHLDQARTLSRDLEERLRNEWWLVLAESGRLQEAEPYLPQLLVNPGEDAAEICEAFVNGFCLNLRFDSAMVLLDAWQADDPKDFRPHFRRGQIYAGSEEWKKAENEYREAIRLAPENTLILTDLAKALTGLGKFSDAEPLLKTVLDRHPQDLRSLIALADLLRERREFSEAQKYLERAVALAPNDFVTRQNLCRVLMAGGQVDQAEVLSGQLYAEWPEDLGVLYTRASLLRMKGNTAEAEKLLKKYSELNGVLPELERLKREVNAKPGDPEIRFQIGRLMLRHVNRDEGVAWLRSVLLLNPEHAEAQREIENYESLRKAQAVRHEDSGKSK